MRLLTNQRNYQSRLSGRLKARTPARPDESKLKSGQFVSALFIDTPPSGNIFPAHFRRAFVSLTLSGHNSGAAGDAVREAVS
jgi:hypothetical protein